MAEFLKAVLLCLKVMYNAGTIAKALQVIVESIRVAQNAGLITDSHIGTAANLLQTVEPWVTPNAPVAVMSLPPQVTNEEETTT